MASVTSLPADRTPTRAGEETAPAEDPAGNVGAPGQDPEIWRQYATRLPIGAGKNPDDGSRALDRGLLTVDDAGVTVKPKTRIPEPAHRLRSIGS